MPLMGGDVALKHIMIRSPAPVVLLSGFSPTAISKVMEFLRLGAVDFIPKPKDSGDWVSVSKRLGGHVTHAGDFKVRNIRRAKPPSPSHHRIRPGLPGDRLLIILGGAGGLLEIQRILPAMPGDGSLSILVFQDMSRELVAPVCEYLGSLSKLTVLPLESGGPLLSSQCWATNWDMSWQVVSDENGAAVRACASRDEQGANYEILLSTASAAFGERIAVLVLSGTDLDLEFGLQEVASRGGRVLLQNPDSALCPSPVQQLVSMELEEACVEPEEAGGLIAAWCHAGTRDR
jgi:two-component system chemotaxis response regulator CheB